MWRLVVSSARMTVLQHSTPNSLVTSCHYCNERTMVLLYYRYTNLKAAISLRGPPIPHPTSSTWNVSTTWPLAWIVHTQHNKQQCARSLCCSVPTLDCSRIDCNYRSFRWISGTLWANSHLHSWSQPETQCEKMFVTFDALTESLALPPAVKQTKKGSLRGAQ